MRKKVHTFSLITFTLAAAEAAVTQRWTVETSRVQPVVFEAVRGETLSLEATFQSYGRPVEMPLNGCCMLWQTNGMGSAWWQAPAAVVERTEDVGQRTETNHSVRATFTPAMDPGAETVIGFLGATGQNYRAAFRLRFRHGPGERPNTIAGPVPILDLAHTTVINPPWPTAADLAATTAAMLENKIDAQAATNAANAAITNQVANNYLCTKAWADNLTANFCTVEAAQAMRDTRLSTEGLLTWEEIGYKLLHFGGFAQVNTTLGRFYANQYSADSWNSFIGPIDQTLPEFISSTAITNGGAKAYADATFVSKTGAVVRTTFKIREYENNKDIIRKDTSVDGVWHFVGVADTCESVGAGNYIYIKRDGRKIVFDTSGYAPPNASELTPDRSPVVTSNMLERVIASKPAPSPLTGKTYDFANGSNFTMRVYTALTNVIQALGGSVTNAPSFE